MPGKLRGQFIRCEQDIQDLHTGDDMMVSRIHFVILDNNGKQHLGSVTVRQQAGGDYRDDLEVGSLEYASDAPPLQYQEFRDLVERYYRHLIGPTRNGDSYRARRHKHTDAKQHDRVARAV